MTVWVEFTDEFAFRAFHDAACADLGIPFHGHNAATGAPEPDSQWTTAYVNPLDDHGVIKALVRDQDVATYGLVSTDEPVYSYAEDGMTLVDGPTVPTWDWHQPVPESG